MDLRTLHERPLRNAVDLLRKAQRPLIITGGGVHYSLATETLREFAKTFQIPVCETQSGKSAMSWKDEMSVGGVGVTGTAAANLLAKDADLILAVGSRLQDFTTSSKHAFSKQANILHLKVSTFDGNKMNGIALLADAKSGLEALSSGLKKIAYKSSADYANKVSQLKSEWNTEVDRLYALKSDSGNVQTQILGTLNEFMAPADVILCAAGSLPGDLDRLWRCELPKTYHLETDIPVWVMKWQGRLEQN